MLGVFALTAVLAGLAMIVKSGTGAGAGVSMGADGAAAGAGATSEKSIPGSDIRLSELEAIRAQEDGADGVITEAEALRLVREKTPGVVLVDARPEVFYLNAHLDGAINVAVDNFAADYARHQAVLSQATRIIVYCNGGNCPASREVVKLLRRAGVKTRMDMVR